MRGENQPKVVFPGETPGDAPDAPAGAKLLGGLIEKETKGKGRNAR